jgi:hypothetical protein
MVDPHLQERFTRRCTDAAFGYTAATTAAYATFAEQVLNFWADVLAPPKQSETASPAWGWPAPARRETPPMPFAPFFWAAAPQRSDRHAAGFPFAGFPFAGSPFAIGASPSPMQAWFDMWAAPPASWPMAFMMIASGMPRSVAWPTAEANAAVMDAADAAAVSVRQAFASYRSEGGHSGRQLWPPAQLMMLAALMPLGFGAMLMNVRVA